MDNTELIKSLAAFGGVIGAGFSGFYLLTAKPQIDYQQQNITTLTQKIDKLDESIDLNTAATNRLVDILEKYDQSKKQ